MKKQVRTETWIEMIEATGDHNELCTIINLFFDSESERLDYAEGFLDAAQRINRSNVTIVLNAANEQWYSFDE